MFNLISYIHERVSNFCDVKVRYQFTEKSEIKVESLTFSHPSDADKWIDMLKKKYLIARLEKFVTDAKNIIESSTGHKSHKTKKLILEDITRYLTFATDKATVNEACYWMRKMEDRFLKVIPNEKHKEHLTILGQMYLLIDFAKEQTKDLVYQG